MKMAIKYKIYPMNYPWPFTAKWHILLKKKIINTATDEVKLSITLLQEEGKQLELNKKREKI